MKRRSKGGYTGLFQYIGEAFRRVGEESCAGRHGQAALSGSKPKALGFAGGYLLRTSHGYWALPVMLFMTGRSSGGWRR